MCVVCVCVRVHVCVCVCVCVCVPGAWSLLCEPPQVKVKLLCPLLHIPSVCALTGLEELQPTGGCYGVNTDLSSDWSRDDPTPPPLSSGETNASQVGGNEIHRETRA